MEENFSRKDEIREFMALTSEEVIDRAGERLIVFENIDVLHEHFAKDIADEIKQHNQDGLPTRLILPVGPYGQYPILAKIISTQHISLEQCWFFFMDEYCDEAGNTIPVSHPLSFRQIAQDLFLNQLKPSCGLQIDRVFFPDEKNIDSLAQTIEDIGGIDTCYGGIGIHGHIAFN